MNAFQPFHLIRQEWLKWNENTYTRIGKDKLYMEYYINILLPMKIEVAPNEVYWKHRNIIFLFYDRVFTNFQCWCSGNIGLVIEAVFLNHFKLLGAVRWFISTSSCQTNSKCVSSLLLFLNKRTNLFLGLSERHC